MLWVTLLSVSLQVAPAGKTFTTLEAQVDTGDEARVMVLPQVHGEQLLLPEMFVAGQAGERPLSRVRAHVRGQASLLLARIIALFALELLLILVGPLVLKEGIAFVEGGRAVSALDLLRAVAVQVAQMDTQVTLPRNDGGTVGTLVFGHILAMLLRYVDFHGPTLGEPGMAGGAFVRLLT